MTNNFKNGPAEYEAMASRLPPAFFRNAIPVPLIDLLANLENKSRDGESYLISGEEMVSIKKHLRQLAQIEGK